MISRKLSIVLILIILCSFAQAKDECPVQCDCSDDFSAVKCRGLEKFPVFSFSSKVKTLDLTHGKIKYIHEKDVKAYTNLENLYINHNPLNCDHVTTRTLKLLMRKTAGLKSFDGHKIKCQQLLPKNTKRTHDYSHHHYRLAAGAPLIYFHRGNLGGFSPVTLACGMVMVVLSMLGMAGVCWILIRYRRKLSRESKQHNSDAEDPVSNMEKGTGNESDTTARMLKEGLKKQRRSSQGYPKHAILDSDDEDVVEQEDYLKGKMKIQRSQSQGYALGTESGDEESCMVEIDLN